MDEIVPLLDAIEVIANDMTIEFDSARHILENERMNDALKTIRGSYVAVNTRLEMQQAYDILDAEESWTRVEAITMNGTRSWSAVRCGLPASQRGTQRCLLAGGRPPDTDAA